MYKRQAHTADCGYVEAAAEKPCTHKHDEACGYTEEGGVCTHEHDENCGYTPAVKGAECSYQCQKCLESEKEESASKADPSSDSRSSDTSADKSEEQTNEQTQDGEAPFLRLDLNADEEKGVLNLEAVLEKGGKDSEAKIRIRLEKNEMEALETPLPEGIQLYIPEEEDEDYGEIRFTLTGAEPRLEEKLQFLPQEQKLKIEIEEEDLDVTFSGEGSEKGGYAFEETELSLGALACKWTTKLKTSQKEYVWIEDDPKNMDFELTLKPDTGICQLDTKSQTIEISISLPAPFLFIEGEPSWHAEKGIINLSSTAAVKVSGAGENESCDVRDIEVNSNVMEFTLDRSSLDDEPLGEGKLTLKIYGEALEISETSQTDALSLFSFAGGEDDAEEEPVVTLNADVRSVPYDGETEDSHAAAALAVRAQQGVAVNEFADAMSGNIFWRDGYEQDGRPDSFPAAVLQFREVNADGTPIGGGEWTDLTAQNAASIGVQLDDGEIPALDITDNMDSWSIPAGTLPREIAETNIYGDTQIRYFEWQIVPPEVEGYTLTEITDDNVEDSLTGEMGWYYQLNTDFNFDLTIRWGTRGNEDGQPGIADAIYDSVELVVRYGGGKEERATLKELIDLGILATDLDKTEENTIENTSYCTINNLPKYDTNGNLISYTVEPRKATEEEPWRGDGRLDSNELPDMGNEWYAVSYDNTGTVHGSVTNVIHDGGTIYFTLSGETSFSASKEWLDQNRSADDRPTGVFQLWRYRKGNDPTTAAAVRNSNGSIVEVEVDRSEDTYTFNFDEAYDADGDGTPDPLPKYDAEGYEYVYVVREYLDNAAGYEQVYGKVDYDEETGDTWYLDKIEGQDIQRTEETRSGNYASNIFVYQDGTISNRSTGQTSTTAKKSWGAASFQAALEDVKVEFKLQYRPTGEYEGDDGWLDVTDEGEAVTVEMEDFIAENLGERSETLTVDKYGPLGRELEYRWVESGVYQKGDNGEYGNNLLDKDGYFTLSQQGQEVRYHSESTIEQDESGNWITSVLNTIADTVDLDVEKNWMVRPGDSVTLQLYRISPSGEIVGVNDEKDKPIFEFTLDGEADDKAAEFTIDGFGTFTWQEVTERKEEPVSPDAPEDGNTIFAKWAAEIKGLPKYDDEGRTYEYVLLENGGGMASFLPSYENEVDEDGNMITTITNGPIGGENVVMVRKAWVDDSDTLHREPVTVGIYARNDLDEDTKLPKRIAGTTLTDDMDGWMDQVGIGSYTPADVFIVEEQIGEKKLNEEVQERLEYYADLAGSESADEAEANAPKPRVEADNHDYEITYSEMETIAGRSCYAVTNRRMGNIDIEITKHWEDGGEFGSDLKTAIEAIPEEERPKLVLELEFSGAAEGYKIKEVNEGGTSYHVINLGGDDVPVRDNSGDSTQTTGSPTTTIYREIQLGNGNDTKYYFSYLPKYDDEGRVVHYTVKEVWQATDGTTYDTLEALINGKGYNNADGWGNLEMLWREYNSSIAQTGYTVENRHTRDTQTMRCQNALRSTKDVMWHKQWQDAYTYELGERPDIYLDLYRYTSNPNVAEDDKVELYMENYRWTAVDAGDDPDGQFNEEWHWHATFYGLPRYDANGYEYTYYAIENTSNEFWEFDYHRVRYLVPLAEDSQSTEPIGSVLGPNEGSGSAVGEGNWMMKLDGEIDPDNPTAASGKYMLKEGGTFLNGLEGDAIIKGDKHWTNLPGGYNREADLPTVTFSIDQYLGDKDNDKDVTESGIATLTIKSSDWKYLQNAGKYDFTIEYKGENFVFVDEETGEVSFHPEGDEADWVKLPKYTNDNGALYGYKISETITLTQAGEGADAPEGDEIYTTSATEYSFINLYQNEKNLTPMAVKKHLFLPDYGDGKAFPSVRFELTRTYTKNDGAPSDPETVGTYTWSSAEVQAAWEALSTDEQKQGLVTGVLNFGEQEIYAPNGSRYTYTVREIKDNLNGFDTWGAAGDLEADIVMEDNNKLADDSNASVFDIHLEKQENADGPTTIYATFANRRMNDQEKLERIQGAKKWVDFGNHYHLRGEDFEEQADWNDDDSDNGNITLTLSRHANAQPGQNNAIASEDITTQVTFKPDWQNGKEKEAEKEGSGNTEYARWFYEFVAANPDVFELEKYAPNGMPWIYEVKEDLTGYLDSYDRTVESVSKSAAQAAETTEGDQKVLTLTLGDLENTLLRNISYSKTWVDSEGNPITEDVLGYPVEVTFRIDVAEYTPGTDGTTYEITSDWKRVGEYFGDEANMSSDDFKAVFGEDEDPPFIQYISGYLGDDSVWGKTYTGPTSLPTSIRKPGTNGNSGEVVHLTYRVKETYIRHAPAAGQDPGTGDIIAYFDVETSNDGKTYTYVDKTNDTQGITNNLVTPVYYPDGLRGGEKQNNYSYTRDMYNTLNETKIEVTKRWENDADNAYGTRPTTTRANYTWQTSFVIMRSTDDAVWEHVYTTGAEGAEARPMIVTLYGTNDQDEVSEKITGLPKYNRDGKEYTYQAWELQAYLQDSGKKLNWVDEDNADVAQGIADLIENGTSSAYVMQGGNDKEWYNTSYHTSYENDHLTAVNDMPTTEIYASKEWRRDDTIWQSHLTLYLRYQYRSGNSYNDYRDYKNLNVYGQETTSPSNPYYEMKPDEDGRWMAVWENVPLRLQGSYLPNDESVTNYTVRELIPGGAGDSYITADSRETIEVEGKQYTIFRFVNTQKTSFTVTKTWGLLPGINPQTIEVGVYRTTDRSKVGSKDGELVDTLTFNRGTTTQTVNDLPKFDGNKDLYYYYAIEHTIGGTNVPEPDENGFAEVTGTGTSRFDVYHDWQVDESPHTTAITNIGCRDLTVTKTWVDNGNAYGTRPENLVLNLYRKIEGGEEHRVEVTQPQWGKNGSQWTLTYEDLPMTDPQGNVYIYRLEEQSAGSNYVQKDYQYNENQGSFSLTNLLQETIDIPVTKVWDDNGNALGIRPDSITLELYANGEKVDEVKLSQPNLLVRMFTSQSADRWSHTFKDLSKYDDEGKRITYEVKEVITDALQKNYTATIYPESVDGGMDDPSVTVTNQAFGQLQVTKTVTGEGGDRTKDFHFKVTLDDTTVTGTYGDMTFTNGVATFTLKHGESKTATGLKPDIDYEVVETEADKGGYTTTATGATGTIPAGGTAAVSFENAFTPEPETIELPVTKVWEDNNDQDGIRPESVTVKLLADGKDTGKTLILSEENRWMDTFTDLSQYKDEKEIVYTIEEVAVAGYNAEITGDASKGFTITNSHTPDKPDQLKDDTPRTGDTANLVLWSVLLVISGAGLTAALIFVKKKRRRNRNRK